MLGSVESPSQDEADVLTATAKRHRVDVAKVRTSVETEFAAKQAKTAEKQKKAAPTKPAKPVKAQHKHCVSQKASGICRTPFERRKRRLGQNGALKKKASLPDGLRTN